MERICRVLRFGRSVALLGVIAGLTMTPQVFAQNGPGGNISIPPNMDPGAIMNSNYMYFQMQRQQPYLFRPVTEEDVIQEEPLIIDEQGVLNQKRVRGEVIIKTE